MTTMMMKRRRRRTGASFLGKRLARDDNVGPSL
jgi:hypothetical protein